MHQRQIPRTGQCRGGREASGGNAAVGTKVVGTLALFAQSMGAVGHHDAWNLQSFKPGQVPEIFAGTEVGFFRQCHLCDQGLRLSTQCGIKG